MIRNSMKQLDEKRAQKTLLLDNAHVSESVKNIMLKHLGKECEQ